jgi:glycosyltransferase involved in cell wall biosynthesis
MFLLAQLAEKDVGGKEIDVSVIIPTFNRAELLAETLRSITSQTVIPAEIIIVDNGTNDNTYNMLRTIKHTVKYIRTDPLGVQEARNRGIAEAKNEWVTILDDDDLLASDFFESVEPAVLDGRANMIGTNHRKFDATGATHPKTNFQSAPDGYWDGVAEYGDCARWSFVGHFPAERILRFIAFYPSGMLLKRSLVSRVGGYDPRVRGIGPEDIEMLSRLLPVAQLAVVGRPIVNYRVHSGNISAGWVDQTIGRLQVFEYIDAKNGHGSASLRSALSRDLPQRRVDVFNLAFRHRRYSVVLRLADHLREQDWTWKLRLKKTIVDWRQQVSTLLGRSAVRT